MNKKIIIILISFWFIFNVSRIFNNFFRITYDELSWIRYSDQKQRKLLLGDRYRFVEFINLYNVKNKKVLMLVGDKSSAAGLNYITYFYLYPITLDVKFYSSIESFEKYKNYDFLVFIDKKEKINKIKQQFLNKSYIFSSKDIKGLLVKI
jgi:hypothetical protein